MYQYKYIIRLAPRDRFRHPQTSPAVASFNLLVLFAMRSSGAILRAWRDPQERKYGLGVALKSKGAARKSTGVGFFILADEEPTIPQALFQFSVKEN